MARGRRKRELRVGTYLWTGRTLIPASCPKAARRGLAKGRLPVSGRYSCRCRLGRRHPGLSSARVVSGVFWYYPGSAELKVAPGREYRRLKALIGVARSREEVRVWR